MSVGACFEMKSAEIALTAFGAVCAGSSPSGSGRPTTRMLAGSASSGAVAAWAEEARSSAGIASARQAAPLYSAPRPRAPFSTVMKVVVSHRLASAPHGGTTDRPRTLPTPVLAGSGSAGRGLLPTSQPRMSGPPGDTRRLGGPMRAGKSYCARRAAAIAMLARRTASATVAPHSDERTVTDAYQLGPPPRRHLAARPRRRRRRRRRSAPNGCRRSTRRCRPMRSRAAVRRPPPSRRPSPISSSRCRRPGSHRAVRSSAASASGHRRYRCCARRSSASRSSP